MKVKIIKGVAYCTYHRMSKVFCCIVRDVQKFPGLRRHHQEAIKSLKKEERKKVIKDIKINAEIGTHLKMLQNNTYCLTLA